MKHPDLSLAERLSAAARDLQAANDPQETMDAAVRLAVANVGGADEAGLSLVRRRKRIETPAYTQDVVLAGDRLQNELAEGPCHDAIWEALVIHSADLSREPGGGSGVRASQKSSGSRACSASGCSPTRTP